MTESTAYQYGRIGGRPRDADLEARIDALLETAGTLFLEHGYANTSLKTIAHEAHVAVRTIYVKFGGKAGLFKAVVERGQSRYGATRDLLSDTRAIDDVLEEFGINLLQMMSMPRVVGMYHMVIAVAHLHPEIALAFDQAGPGHTLHMLGRYFARPDIAAQFRSDVTHEQLAVHLYNCLIGNQIRRLMFDPKVPPCQADRRREVAEALAFFYKTVRRDSISKPQVPV